jgi:hypothetical protein
MSSAPIITWQRLYGNDLIEWAEVLDAVSFPADGASLFGNERCFRQRASSCSRLMMSERCYRYTLSESES